jgi:hypothetical protein
MAKREPLPSASVFSDRPISVWGGRVPDEWTLETWAQDQNAEEHNKMTLKWAGLKGLFNQDPWQGQGPNGPKGRMAFMATYNIDEFRDFLQSSSFLKRYKVKKALLDRIRRRRHRPPAVRHGLGQIVHMGHSQ